MKKTIYNKLVRDGIPKIIKDDGQFPVTRILDSVEYRKALLDKLIEESTELRDSDGDIGERVDVAEVLRALDDILKFDSADIETLRAKKANKRGGFEQRLFLESIQADD